MDLSDAFITTVLIVGVAGSFLACIVMGFVAGASNDSEAALEKTKKILIILGIVSFIVIFSLLLAPKSSSEGSSSKHYGSSSNSSSAHECYVCGDNAYKKYEAYYYCSEHYDLVKATYEALND